MLNKNNCQAAVGSQSFMGNFVTYEVVVLDFSKYFAPRVLAGTYKHEQVRICCECLEL